MYIISTSLSYYKYPRLPSNAIIFPCDPPQYFEPQETLAEEYLKTYLYAIQYPEYQNHTHHREEDFTRKPRLMGRKESLPAESLDEEARGTHCFILVPHNFRMRERKLFIRVFTVFFLPFFGI